MAYRQTVSPNLDPYIYDGKKVLTNWLGWCLGYVRAAFNAPYAGKEAWKSWENYTKFPHADRNIPAGVYVPIWFSHIGKYNNEATARNWGHVAIAYIHPTTGAMQIWSSPISAKPFADFWDSIAVVEKKYSSTYVGWSEDIGGMRVIEQVSTPQGGDEMITNADQARLAYKLLRGDAPVSDDEINGTAGKRTWLSFAEGAAGEIAARTKHLQELDRAINDMRATINDLGSRPTNAQYAQAQADLADSLRKLQATQIELNAERNKAKEVVTVYVENPDTQTKLDAILKALASLKGMVANLFKRRQV